MDEDGTEYFPKSRPKTLQVFIQTKPGQTFVLPNPITDVKGIKFELVGNDNFSTTGTYIYLQCYQGNCTNIGSSTVDGNIRSIVWINNPFLTIYAAPKATIHVFQKPQTFVNIDLLLNSDGVDSWAPGCYFTWLMTTFH